ncbi:hypothetical protein HYU89_02670 [Candidatus Collierbacteria bacterium]|nr:hypothetical protein [Candidatus Collierbacteria bacterium]
MINYSVIQKSQLEGAQRLDAEYYQPEYLEKEKRLKNLATIKLGKIAYITDGEHGSPVWDEKSGIKYFSAKHVKDGIIDNSDIQTISKIIDDRNKRSRLQEGDILLSTVGTVGYAGIVTTNALPANIDRHVARIALHPNTLDPEFLVAFLNSTYGRFQTTRQATGNVQLNLFLEKIQELYVPKSNNIQVSKLVKAALQELDRSEKLYSQAEILLLEELGLRDFKILEDLSFIVNFSEVKNAHRMDTDYFHPKYEILESKLKRHGAKTFEEVIMNVPATFNPLAKPDDLFKYVELANINSSIGVIDGYEELLGKEAPSRAKRILKRSDVVVPSVEGSLEKVALVDSAQEGYLASTGFFQLRSKEILPEALLVLAGSVVFQMQLKKRCAGTILTAVPKESISNILIPSLSIETQQKIAVLVCRSHDARKKFKDLLEEAKRKVEEMIEKGSD